VIGRAVLDLVDRDRRRSATGGCFPLDPDA
jgi:hypothetical protein